MGEVRRKLERAGEEGVKVWPTDWSSEHTGQDLEMGARKGLTRGWVVPIVRDMRNETPISAAVLPLKSEAIEHANNEAHRIAETVANMLKAAGNDLKVAAPFPNGSLSRPEYMQKLATYNLFASLTRWCKPTYSANEPMLADIAPDRVAVFVREAEEDAALEYDRFVTKLEEEDRPCDGSRADRQPRLLRQAGRRHTRPARGQKQTQEWCERSVSRREARSDSVSTCWG